MALNARNIHIGAARIWLNVTPPPTGTPPVALPQYAGAPTQGGPIEAGYTTGASTFTYKAEKTNVEAEQSLSVVDIFTSKEMCQIEFTAMEHVYWTLKTAFDNTGAVNNDDMMMFYGGDSPTILNVVTQCVALTSPRRDDPTKFEVITLYKVYNVEGMVIGYQRTTPATFKITLMALPDQCRMPGDRLFQFYREKSALDSVTATCLAP